MSIAAIHVQNHSGLCARCAVVAFSHWHSATVLHETVVDRSTGDVPRPDPYFSGFVQLSALTDAIAQLRTERPDLTIEAIVTKSQVGASANPGHVGIGQRFVESLEPRLPVIGLSKRSFISTDYGIQVARTEHGVPLFVDAAGMDATEARDKVETMAGGHDIPSMLKRADSLTRVFRQWVPKNPGLTDLDSTVPLGRDLESSLAWWFHEGGHVAEGFEEYAGRSEWWPAFTLHAHVPAADADFLEWVVTKTPNRVWTTDELDRLLKAANFPGFFIRQK